jgi:anti-sigma regulatory factor (Ser/Thr protein kinase)
MTNINQRGEQIRQFILMNIDTYPKDIAKVTAIEFGITRQAINKHIQILIKKNLVIADGSTNNRTYSLYPSIFRRLYKIADLLEEDRIWDEDIQPVISGIPKNIRSIWYYGFTEMMNNAIDHSSGSEIFVEVRKTATNIKITIFDDGEGIFKKIQTALQLHDEKHAVLELAKGKLTTDPIKHSGQGIFFTSRMFDTFEIISGKTYFFHEFIKPEDWILEPRGELSHGTFIIMTLSSQSQRTSKEVFDRFSSEDGEYSFDKTVIPVQLAQHGGDELISRSQAKRLLARVDKFARVIFDFAHVEAIGQAFADEIFRVFRRQHPEIEINHINSNQIVSQMIRRAESSSTG